MFEFWIQSKTTSYRDKLLQILGVLFVIKLFLSYFFPLTGDEAYFYLWSQYLAPTFYDHPPMIGWVIHLFSKISTSVVSIRFLGVIAPLMIAWFIFYFFRDYSESKSFYAALALAFAPFDLLHILITNDTTLLLFGFFAVIIFLKALEKSSYFLSFLSGSVFGMAFLSKYLAFILAVGLMVGVISVRYKKRYLLFIIAFLGALPFLLFNLFANIENCWTNVIFNLNRAKELDFSFFSSLSIFILFVVYLLTPFLFFYLVKKRKDYQKLPERFKFLGSVALAILILFMILTVNKEIGLHWLLFMIPLFFMVGIGMLDETQWIHVVKQSFWIGSIHVVLLTLILAIPYEKMAKWSLYQNNVYYMYPETVKKIVVPQSDEYAFATESYALSSYLNYYTGVYFSVFGSGSNHGREDDRITDYSLLDGKNIAIVDSNQENLEQFAVFFETVLFETYPIEKGKITIMYGKHFNYQVYKQKILLPVFKKYYTKPSYLQARECFWKKYGLKQ